jgi:hypothetical protein
MATAPKWAWHYTSSLGMAGILGSGFIRVSTIAIGRDETPLG